MNLSVDTLNIEKYGLDESFIISLLRSKIYLAWADDEIESIKEDNLVWVRFSIDGFSKALFWITPRTIQRKLQKLKDNGIILCRKSQSFQNSNIWNESFYALCDESFLESQYLQEDAKMASSKMPNWSLREQQEKEKKRKEPKEKNNKENNIYYNCYTTSFSVKEKENDIPKGISQDKMKNCGSDEPCLDESRRCIIDDVVRFLNDTTGKHFRSNTVNTRKHINARITDGYTLDDFKRVIVYKAQQWGNDAKMKEYLRPETLFGTKFEGYLNSVPDDLQIVEKVEKTAEELEIEKILEGYQ